MQFIYLFCTTFFVVGILTPVMRKIALKTKFMDKPNQAHKTHLNPVPYLGGVAIMVGILFVTYVSLIITNSSSRDIWLASSLYLPAIILGFIGFLDDRNQLPPLPRLAAQTIAGIFTSFFLIATNTVGNPTGNKYLDISITIIWVVGITNAINFFDNLDGGAAGTVAISSFGIFMITKENDQHYLAALSICIFGSMLSFLFWNKSPARIYMGDAGSLFLGVLLAGITLRLEPNLDDKFYSFSIPALLMIVPIIDVTVVVFSRIKRGVSPFRGGQDHLSHRIISLGFSKQKTVYALWSLSGINCLFAIFVAKRFITNDFLFLSILCFPVLITFFFSSSLFERKIQ